MAHIGILHPGEMGVSIGAAARHSGNTVYWASAGRSAQTAQRAQLHGLTDAHTLAALCETCAILISICPPDAAEDMARDIVAQGFKGIYVDANAIAPQRAQHLARLLQAGGAAFVDGGIIGGPAWVAGATWLYLSGNNAEEIAVCFANSPLMTDVIGTEIGAASALKMCYAAYTKGTTALLCAVLGAADSWRVGGDLTRQWSRDGAGLDTQAGQRASAVTAKAWRFAGEMDEIATTFAAAGMPSGFHEAAADIYRRLAEFKGGKTPPLEDVLAALRRAV